MKQSLLFATLVAMLGLAACNKPAPAPAPYTGPNKAAYDAAVEKCKSQPFDSRGVCVKEIMADVEKSQPAATAPAAPAAPAPAPAQK